MDYTVLGRTGLTVSVMGLGCGGHSRLGMAYGKSEDEAAALIRQALDLGVTLVDTAEGYGTEGAVGKALAGHDRGQVVVCTKKSPRGKQGLIDGQELRRCVDASLTRLRTDYVDVLYLHGVAVGDYDYAVTELAPVLESLREEGKIRFTGITEGFASDPQHATLQRAVRDDCWDVMMVGFNLLNQSARDRLFPVTREKRIGVTNMFAVRRALSRPEVLREVLDDLAARKLIDLTGYDAENPLGFLLRGDVPSLTDACYRFCRYEPGVDVVLFGTGNPAHLQANIASLLRPPLPEEHSARLRTLFRQVDCVSAN